MIKIKLIVNGFLSNNKSLKGGKEIIELEYEKSVTIRKLMIEAKIKLEFLGLIILDGKNIDQDFLVTDSCQIKLFPILGGG